MIQGQEIKDDVSRLKRYWRFSIPLCLFLALMIKYPIRIGLREITYDAIFYGAICLICLVLAIQVYRRFKKHKYGLIALLLLSFLLSGWQVFDLLILRKGSTPLVWGSRGFGRDFTDYDSAAWFELRFPNKGIMCHTLYEQYWGTELISITVRINRDATWYACGG